MVRLKSTTAQLKTLAALLLRFSITARVRQTFYTQTAAQQCSVYFKQHLGIGKHYRNRSYSSWPNLHFPTCFISRKPTAYQAQLHVCISLFSGTSPWMKHDYGVPWPTAQPCLSSGVPGHSPQDDCGSEGCQPVPEGSRRPTDTTSWRPSEENTGSAEELGNAPLPTQLMLMGMKLLTTSLV